MGARTGETEASVPAVPGIEGPEPEGSESDGPKPGVPPFGAWLKETTPRLTWDWPHLVYIRERLDRITCGADGRLMLFLPPRHGKSEQVTIHYPVWRLDCEPQLRIIVGAYNQTLASKFSRRSRRIAAGLKASGGDPRIRLSADRKAVEEWETAAGGGLRAVGMGAGITGQGGHLIVIDDPVKSREEAESEAYRERVWDWYRDDLYTRLEPGGAIILIMTRWHPDDLAGRLLAEMENGGDRWEVVRLPAEAEEDDPLGRPPGAALCPERYDEASLARIRRVLGPRGYSALYQQRPEIREGNRFKRDWFRIVDAAPAVADRVRYWDKASVEGDGDYTVGVRMARAADGLFYVEDVVRGQWSPGGRDRVMLQTAALDGAAPGDVQIRIEQEPGSGGRESAEASIRLLAGYAVRAERATGEKAVRADPFAAQCEAGNVRLVKGAWNAAYIEELCAFPAGKHDDQVDASSGAFNQLCRERLLEFS